MAAAIKHCVGLQGDEFIDIFRNDQRTFDKVRIVVHSTNVWPSGLSENHVSIFLLIRNEEKSVRLNMRTEDGYISGYLEWSRHDYQRSQSAIVAEDYQLKIGDTTVSMFYNARRNSGLHQYEFSGGGSGCRYWV